MNDSMVFITGMGLTLAASLTVVAYMRIHLQRILVDLCGTEERAKFWAVFSNVVLVLTPLIFAMSYRPQSGASVLFELTTQIKWGFIGLIGSVLMLGIIVSWFILQQSPRKPASYMEPAPRQPEIAAR